MSLSTTTTATYNVLKYARAYNHSNTASNRAGPPELEWQHFSNPVIRLTLDTRKAPDGRLESMRVRVLWKLSAGFDCMDVDQREAVFEDIDLVAYCVVPSFQTPHNVPIRVAYQDATVGLRYQYPRVAPPGQAPQYRRFQVNFETEASATAFVESVRFICPCRGPSRPSQIPSKSVPTKKGTHIITPTTVHAPALRYAASTTAVDGPTPPPIATSVRRTKTTLPTPLSRTNSSSSLSGWNDFPTQQGISALGTYTTSDKDPRPTTSGSVTANSSRPSSATAYYVSSDLSAPTSSDPASTPTRTLSEQGSQLGFASSGNFHGLAMHPTKRTTAGGSGDTDSSSLPPSSPPPTWPSRARSPELMPPPPVPRPPSLPRDKVLSSTSASTSQAAVNTTPNTPPDSAAVAVAIPTPSSVATSATLKSDVIATLRDSAGLYDLERGELELLVREIVREEGFADLMCSLDRMLRIKGLVGIPTSAT